MHILSDGEGNIERGGLLPAAGLGGGPGTRHVGRFLITEAALPG